MCTGRLGWHGLEQHGHRQQFHAVVRRGRLRAGSPAILGHEPAPATGPRDCADTSRRWPPRGAPAGPCDLRSRRDRSPCSRTDSVGPPLHRASRRPNARDPLVRARNPGEYGPDDSRACGAGNGAEPVRPRVPEQPVPDVRVAPRGGTRLLQRASRLLGALALRRRAHRVARHRDLHVEQGCRARGRRPGRVEVDDPHGPARPHAHAQGHRTPVHAAAHRRAGADRALVGTGPRRAARRPCAVRRRDRLRSTVARHRHLRDARHPRERARPRAYVDRRVPHPARGPHRPDGREQERRGQARAARGHVLRRAPGRAHRRHPQRARDHGVRGRTAHRRRGDRHVHAAHRRRPRDHREIDPRTACAS